MVLGGWDRRREVENKTTTPDGVGKRRIDRNEEKNDEEIYDCSCWYRG
ncbi:MAG: hypothetical protein MR304_00965 [Eubacterium sp.]|nr:hypothetical protein [Eubacterium sp.]